MTRVVVPFKVVSGSSQVDVSATYTGMNAEWDSLGGLICVVGFVEWNED